MNGLWIGTSGYSYKHWMNGVFYPDGLPSGQWFEYYCTRYDTVELNVSFYRLPKPEVFAGWHRRSPRGFLFFVKGSRFITHIKRLKDPGPPLDKFFSSVGRLKEKLAGVLWQFPPQFKPEPDRLAAFLDALGGFPAGRQVFEFRDPGWFTPGVAKCLRRAGAAFCRADLPDFYLKLKVPDTADFVYIRRHGPGRQAPGPDYPRERIEKDARLVRRLQAAGKEVFVYFNNDPQGAAIRNADALIRLSAPAPSRRSAAATTAAGRFGVK